MTRMRKLLTLLWLCIMAVVTLSSSLADDGPIFRRNISKTPAGETEEASIAMMPFYVPAQSSDGELVILQYTDAEGQLIEERDAAKPQVAIYIDGIEEETAATGVAALSNLPGVASPTSIDGGVSFGRRDAFAALSLDDGTSWKRYNLSRSADLSSFTLQNGLEYPGDNVYMVFAASGNKVFAAWLSKYCDGGTPAYTLLAEEKAALAAFMGLEENALYLEDVFGIAGAQQSVDYSAEFPEVGEIPFSCVWTARATLEQDAETGLYDLVWRKAERMTSGRRDANRIEVAGAGGAGFVMVWQEDPEGLRPGQGLGPGEGWSGAIVNGQTDVWYSYIQWDDFDLVQDPTSDLPAPITLADYLATGDTTMPKAGIPMAMPTRLTDNGKCQKRGEGDYTSAYCDPTGIDVDGDGIHDLPPLDINADGTPDVCPTTVSWTNPGGTTQEICQTEDGRVLWGRVGSSRPRINLLGYDSDGDTVDDSAWIVMAYEESKALGEGGDEELDPIDIGKNVWYHTFDMFAPEMVAQGMQLNPPALCNPHDAADPEIGCTEGAFYPMLLDDFGVEFYETEIARRFNLMTQDPDKMGPSRTSAMLIYKQGIINQGGPADIFLRRLVVPADFNAQTDNPYDYANLACVDWAFADGTNPRYTRGLCLDPGINVSANEIVACDNGSGGEDCAAAFPWDGGTEDFPKVVEWLQTPESLVNESWENPYDVAKGHRGFIDGDFIMMMYAWAPNWKANSVGNDHYNLYIRRSFDGGLTWTTTPAALGGDGTTTCENYGHGSDVTPECTTYAAGEFEQARNVSQLIGNRITVLDPRYSPTAASILTDGGYLYPDDERDPSKFWVVFETGDNTTVEFGEATPLDLFYSRATAWGDDYFLVCPQQTEVCETTDMVWDWIENKTDDLSGEAAVLSNPAGTFMYTVWNQWQEDEDEHIHDSDIWYRRIMFLDDVDGLPTASISYASHSVATYDAGDLTFVGVGKDNDQMGAGIVAYEWTSSLDGLLSSDVGFTVPVSALSAGRHEISFRVQDNEGNWSRAVVRVLLVGDMPYTTFSPFVTCP